MSVGHVGQNFTFVLTDIESKQRFGFCRLSSGAHSCHCILRYKLLVLIIQVYISFKINYFFVHLQVDLIVVYLFLFSYLPWFEVFYKLLNILADYSTKGQVSGAHMTKYIIYHMSLGLLCINVHIYTIN